MKLMLLALSVFSMFTAFANASQGDVKQQAMDAYGRYGMKNGLNPNDGPKSHTEFVNEIQSLSIDAEKRECLLKEMMKPMSFKSATCGTLPTLDIKQGYILQGYDVMLERMAYNPQETFVVSAVNMPIWVLEHLIQQAQKKIVQEEACLAELEKRVNSCL